MSYTNLVKLFHIDKEEYKKEYEKRINSLNCVPIGYEIKGYTAFYVLNTDVTDLIFEILRLDKEAYKLSSSLPAFALMQYNNKSLIDEIVKTNNIEGVKSTRREISDVLDTLKEQSKKANKEAKFTGLVDRYKRIENCEEISLKTCKDIRDLYDEIVLKEVVFDDKDNIPDGIIFRKDSSEIWSETGKIIHRGKYPESEIISSLDKALTFLNSDGYEGIIKTCIFHFLLEDIHPFYDGNGRLGRFIFSYSLSLQLEPIISYHISNTIKENIKKYYKAFEICEDERNMGDLTPFLLMMLNMIKESYLDIIQYLKDSIEKMNNFEEKIPSLEYGNTEIMRSLYSLLIGSTLFSENGISIEELTSILDISKGTLIKKLSIVESQNVLVTKKIGYKKYYKMALNN